MSAAPQHDPSIDPVEAMLADRALWGRTEAMHDAVDAVSLRLADHLDESFECAAATADLALFPPNERPPAALAGRVTDSLVRLSQATAATVGRSPMPIAAAATDSSRVSGPAPHWGWYAAAIAMAIAAVAWWPEFGRTPATPPASPDFLVARLLEEPTTTRVQCACTEDPLCTGEATCGDIVWNGERGEGFLRVSGIAPNDPGEFQYQLWIVDSTRDERYPVDGGVFDMPSDCSEVIVPIRAAVPVGEAALFAVSVEKPGGTVVSDRRFVAVAPIG